MCLAQLLLGLERKPKVLRKRRRAAIAAAAAAAARPTVTTPSARAAAASLCHDRCQGAASRADRGDP
eukprot:COSAG01_NODE_4247_length_5209_cov_2.889237_2_plen_67_part_00